MNTYARPRLALFPSLRVAELRERQSENGVGSAVNSCRWINIRYYVSCLLPRGRGGGGGEREGGGRNARSGACLSGVRASIKFKIFRDGDNAKVNGAQKF